MKFLLICFLAVQITAVFCTYRRHGQASFLLRKGCEELAGMKIKVAGLEEEVAELKEEVAGLKEGNSAMKQPVDGQWAGWMQWSGCSNNCGPGTRTRQRLCLDPRPSNEGSDCSGSASETENCTITGCEDPYSAFSIYGKVATYQNGVLRWAETNLNIAPNNGAHYNTSSGKYCAEYYGTYAFHLHLHKPSSTGLRVYCYIIKEPQSGSDARIARAYNGGSYSASTTAIVDLEKGDCVCVGNCTRPEDINTLTSYSGTLLDLLD